MNQASVYDKLYKLSEEDLISFRANLHSGLVPMHIWESRMEIIQDLDGVVTHIANDKGYTLPPKRDLMRMINNSKITPDESLQKYLGVSWKELEKSYFEESAPSK